MGHYKRKNDMDEIFGTEITNVVTENTNITAEESVAEYSKMNLGTFCKSVGMETQQGKKMYHLEDAYGNVKKFEESQVLMNMKLGMLNVINLEISKNNKIIRKTPEALEVTYNNINDITYFPCLVKIFDLTTETEGTAVAVGYKEHNTGDKYKTVLNVVIKGNMYEASYRSILSQETTCKKKGCLKCDERNSRNCRYNRYGGGWKLCVEIGKERPNRVKYGMSDSNSELLAVAVEDGGVRAYLKKTCINEESWCILHDFNNFNDKHFKNATRWGGILEYNVPVINWKEFNKKREKRLEELSSLLLGLSWQAVKEDGFELYNEECNVYAMLSSKKMRKAFDRAVVEYKRLGGDIYDVFEEIDVYFGDMCRQEKLELWWIQVDEFKYICLADKKGNMRGKNRMMRYYDELVDMFVNDFEWEKEEAIQNIDTNLFNYR